MTKEALIQEIRRLPVEEQIDLLSDVWDELGADSETVPVPAWHLRELELRLSEPDPVYIPLDAVRRRLNGEEPG